MNVAMEPEHINAFFDEYLADDAIFIVRLTDGRKVEGEWTGHGTDMTTGEEDVWIGDQNLCYSEISSLRVERS